MIKLKYVTIDCCNGVIGNIATAYTNHSGKGLWYIAHTYTKWTGTQNDWHATSNNVSGNISVFSNKYDIEDISIQRYSNITGEVKSLKNLKKLRQFICLITSITGSKTDLYNNGANCSYFSI